ncbi:hypothetical protein [Alkalihalobacillus sp. 1P02AB]|uniref:Ppx/GppA phosphatase family protein n=1 Tax=Alkalihalobacillus sp. 1P02AB TaxID=3132260 RepID=UPI0039A401D3
MSYYAIIEIGSHSIKCTICKYHNYAFILVTTKKVQIHLAKKLVNTFELQKTSIKKVLWALSQFKKVQEAYRCKGTFVFATGVVRLAKNREVLKRKIDEQFHYKIHILSGNLEAFLGYLGVQTGKNKLEHGLILDTGGASSELTIVSNQEAIHFKSFPYGAITLSDRFFQEADKSRESWQWFVQSFSRQLQVERREINLVEFPTYLITIGGSHHFLKSIFKLDRQATIPANDLQQKLQEYVAYDEEQLSELKGLPKRRVPFFKGGILPLLSIIQAYSISEVIFQRTSITEGIIFALNQTHLEHINKDLFENSTHWQDV